MSTTAMISNPGRDHFFEAGRLPISGLRHVYCFKSEFKAGKTDACLRAADAFVGSYWRKDLLSDTTACPWTP